MFIPQFWHANDHYAKEKMKSQTLIDFLIVKAMSMKTRKFSSYT